MRVLLTFLFMMAASAVTYGADLGGKAPTFSPIPEASSGLNTNPCYVMGGIGLGVARSEVSGGGDTIPLSSTGFLGTLGGGCDARFAGNWLIGLWATYDLGKSDTKVVIGGTELKADLKDQWALGGRAGYFVQPGTLLYVNLGYASAEAAFKGPVSTSKTLDGLLLGTGVETKLFGPLSIRLEYDATLYRDATVEGSKLETLNHKAMTGLIFRF